MWLVFGDWKVTVSDKKKLETIIFEVIAVFWGGLEPILSEVFSNVICDGFVLNVIGLRFFCVCRMCCSVFVASVFLDFAVWFCYGLLALCFG